MISLSLLSLVGRTRSWGRFLFITRQRGHVCCCSSVITCMISIYKGCVLGQWDCYNILFCFIASKTFLFYWKLISIYESLRTEKLLFQKCMNFLNYIMFGYIYICMSGKFPIFLSPPVQLCRLFSSIQWNNLYHCYCHMTWTKSNYLHI